MALCHNKQFENYYCHLCRERGQFAVRVAGSGASEGACCDVILLDERAYLVEVKTTKEPIFKLTNVVKQQLTFLREQALRVNAVPLLAIRFKNRGWREINISSGIPPNIEYVNT